MKKQNVLMTLAVVATLVFAGVACKFDTSDSNIYKNTADKFSVSFPHGSSGVMEWEDVRPRAVSIFAKSLRLYNRGYSGSDKDKVWSFKFGEYEYLSYAVSVYDLDSSKLEGKSESEILEAFFVTERPLHKEITVNEKKGLDIVFNESGSSAHLREVVFFSKNDSKIYKLSILAQGREIVNAKETNDFINSFKFGE